MNAKLAGSLILLLTAGCGGAANMAESASPPPAPGAAESVTSVGDSPAAKQASAPVAQTTPTNAKSAPTDGKTATTGVEQPDVLVMYTGDVTLAVDGAKLADTIDRIADIAESVGGHLGARKDQGIMVQVPSARFRETLGKVASLGDVAHESVTAEDVSEEYHDAEVRLANLKATRQRLQDFLTKSANLGDMLTLEHELERVTMDIDRIEGRMRFLREHVAFSTLTVALIARPSTQVIAGGGAKPVQARRVMQLKAEWLDAMGVPKLVGSSS